MNDDERSMQQAIELASKVPNLPFEAVIVDRNSNAKSLV